MSRFESWRREASKLDTDVDVCARLVNERRRLYRLVVDEVDLQLRDQQELRISEITHILASIKPRAEA